MWSQLKKGKGLPLSLLSHPSFWLRWIFICSLQIMLPVSSTAQAGEWSSAIQSGFLQFDHIVIPIAPRDPFLAANPDTQPPTTSYSAIPLGVSLGYDRILFPAQFHSATNLNYVKAVTVNTPTSSQNATPSYSRLDLSESLSSTFIHKNFETGGLIKLRRDGFSDGSLTHTFVGLSLGLKADAKINSQINFVSSAYHSVWGEFGFSDRRDWIATKIKDSAADVFGWNIGIQTLLGEKTRALAQFERENVNVRYRSYDAYEPYGFTLANDQEFVTRNLHLDTDLYSITLVRIF